MTNDELFHRLVRISERDRDKLARYLVEHIDRRFHHLKELITMTNAELQAALDAVATQLGKATDEIKAEVATLTAEVAAAGGTTPEVDASLSRLMVLAQALDDLNPDTPAPAPAPAP
jgi:hypothetical protein